MNNRHRKTLVEVFTLPVPQGIAWADIEALLAAAGAKIVEGRGSRVRFVMGSLVATFHRPHPEKEAKPYQVRAAKEF
jgi:hypothetical protein